MATVNKAILVGYLGSDPEVRYSASGEAICNLRVATSERWNDRASGEKKEVTEWHRIVLYRKLAEIAAKYLSKGSQVYIEGRIRTRKWIDQDGRDRYTTEVECHELVMLGGKGASREDALHNRTQDARKSPPGQSNRPFEEDDIPF